MTNISMHIYDTQYMYDIPTDMCVHKAYVHDYSTQQRPGVKAKRRARCIAHCFRITEAEKSNYGNVSCYYAVRFHGPLRNKKNLGIIQEIFSLLVGQHPYLFSLPSSFSSSVAPAQLQ